MLSRYFITALSAASTAFADITEYEYQSVCDQNIQRPPGFRSYKADKRDFEMPIPECLISSFKVGDIVPLNITAAATEISQLVSEGLLTPIDC